MENSSDLTVMINQVNGSLLTTIHYESMNLTELEPTSSSTGSPNYYEYPIRGSLYNVIPLTVIYSIIFLTGMLGNIITCIVISRNKTMHTATNYYLFSLAISDLLLLISGLPQEIYGIWYRYPYPFNETVCVLQGLAAETSANATVLTITAFTVERYVAICHPFLSHTMSKLSRAIKFILAIWLIAICLAIPQILDLGITVAFTCTMKRSMNKHLFTLSTVLVFVLPMIVITVLYVLIGLQLRRSKVVKRGTVTGSSVKLKHNMFKKPSSQRAVVVQIDQIPQPNTIDSMNATLKCNSNQKGNQPSTILGNNNGMVDINSETDADHAQTTKQINQHLQLQQSVPAQPENGRINYSNKAPPNHGTRHVVNMLVAVVVAFFICWAPHHAQRLYAMYSRKFDDERVIDIYHFITHVSGVLYFISTCINPLLYNIMSHKFREAFKDTIARYLYRRNGQQIPPDYFKSTVELYPMVVANHNSNAMCYRTGQELKNDSI